MKKTWFLTDYRYLFACVEKFFRIMRISIFLIVFASLQTFALSNYAQTKKIDIKIEQASIVNVLAKLEHESEFFFFYNNSVVDRLDKTISIDVKDKTINELLDVIFNGTGVEYTINNRQIILSSKDQGNSANQQQKPISGKVTDSSGGSLPGVSVVVKGTTIGTTTDSNGNYSLSNIPENAILKFSFIGMKTEEVAVGSKTVINTTLEEETIGIEEVVAIGYGTRLRKDVTGSISTVTAKGIENTPFASPEFALQGKVSGVRVINTSGNPSDPPSIYIRGIGTWNGKSQPLYVIDGQIITPTSSSNQDLIGNVNLWSLISPEDIESMSVLKDASSTAIYGSRGANGVILITTKKGKKGKPVLEFNSSYGIQNVPTYNKLLNSKQLMELNREMYTNNTSPDVSLNNNLYGRDQTDLATLLNNYSPQLDPTSPYYLTDNPANYNWQNELAHKNAINQSYDAKVSGATESANYYISVGYRNQESVLRGNDMERYTLTSNVNTDIGKYFRTGINFRLTSETSDNNTGSDLQSAAGIIPWQPIYDATNKYGYALPVNPYFGGSVWNPVRLYGQGTAGNFFATRSLNISTFNLFRSMGQGFLEFQPIKGLVFKGALNVDWTYQQRKEFMNVESEQFKVSGQDPASFGNGSSYGSYGLRTNKFLNYQADYTVSYIKSFGLHSINLLGGVQSQRHTQIAEDLESTNSSTADPKKLGINKELQYVDGFAGTNQQLYWFSYFGRAGYNYNSTYYLDLSMRRDGSNGFPPGNQFGNFYSASGAWRISSMPFMKELKLINDLKLRAGWGQAGNDEAVVGNYAFFSSVSNQGTYRLGSGNGDPKGNYNLGITISDFPNTDLKWETVNTTNIGLEGTLFDNKLTFNVEVYKRLTKNILQTVNLPLSVGTNSPIFNIGSLQNTGLDLELAYNGKIRDFNYSIGGNISFLKNKVLELYNHAPLDLPDSYGRVEEGKPIGIIRGYKVGGIFQNQTEIDQYFAKYDVTTITDKTLVKPGDMYFQDVHGDPTVAEPFYAQKPDGKIDDYDQTDLGSTIPGFTYGVNVSANWKRFDINLSFYGEGDVVKVNSYLQDFESMSGPGANKSITVLNRWTTTNPSTTMPRAVYGDPAKNDRLSNRWVESAAFFRLNTWQFGYSIPESLFRKVQLISKARVFVGGQNNILVTNWSGLDPVNNRYPLPKMINFGVNIKF